MIKVFFRTSWRKNTKGMYDIYTPRHDGVWGKLRACNTERGADVIVVMQGGAPNVNRKKTVFFQREPLVRHKDYSDALYYGCYRNHYHVQTWWVLKKFKFLAEAKPPRKTKQLSAIISGKCTYPGHKFRRGVVMHYAKHHDIDWFGSEVKPGTPGYTGPIPGRCKWSGLAQYRYSLAVENSQIPNYFTEKITDCFLAFTKPIYWGCPNISEYFPPESYAVVKGKTPAEVSKRIREEIEKPVDMAAIEEARRLVLQKYNLWPSLARILNATKS